MDRSQFLLYAVWLTVGSMIAITILANLLSYFVGCAIILKRKVTKK
jgi:hypothetical protein